MEGGAALVKTASIRERAGSARALQILQEEEEEERRLSLELAEVQEEIAALAVAEPASADPGWQKKKKKKKKRRRRKGSAGTPAAETPTASSATAAAEEGTRAELVHTRSQIADLARVLSRPAGAAETAEQAALARTRSQIAALRSTLSLDAAAEAAAAAEVAAAEGLSEEQQLEAQLARLGKRVAQIRPDGDCLFSSVADQLRRIGARQPALPACYDVC